MLNEGNKRDEYLEKKGESTKTTAMRKSSERRGRFSAGDTHQSTERENITWARPGTRSHADSLDRQRKGAHRMSRGRKKPQAGSSPEDRRWDKFAGDENKGKYQKLQDKKEKGERTNIDAQKQSLLRKGEKRRELRSQAVNAIRRAMGGGYVDEGFKQADYIKMKRKEDKHARDAFEQGPDPEELSGKYRSKSRNRALKMSGIRDAMMRGEDPRKDTRGGAYARRGNPDEDHRANFTYNQSFMPNYKKRRTKKAGVGETEDVKEAKTFEEFMIEAYMIMERPYQIYGPDPHGASDAEPKPLGKPYKNKKRAKTRADKLDQEIGGYRHFVRKVDDN